MAYCPVPDVVSSFIRDPSPGVLTLNPPAASAAVCDAAVTNSVTTGGSTPISTTTTVQGPPGPPGPAGTSVPHDGIKWSGPWSTGVEYKANTPATPQHADMVKIDGGAVFVCIQNHTASGANRPELSTFEGPVQWPAYWQLVVEPNQQTVEEEQLSFLESLYEGVFDWIKNATIGDWLKAIAIGAGITWAGSAILDEFLDDGSGTGDQDSRYNGSPTFSGVYTPPSLRATVASLCTEAGIASYDVSLLDDTIPVHFNLMQSTSVRTVLDAMAKAFLFDMVDSSGTLKFVPRGQASIRTFTVDDLGFTSSDEVIAPVTKKRLQSVDLPRSVSLTYQAEDIDYNNFTQRSEIPTFTVGNDVNLSVPFVIEHARAKEVTENILIGAHLERTQFAFKVSYKQGIDLEPGDVITIPGAIVRIEQIDEVEDGILEIIASDAGAVGAPQPIFSGPNIIGYTASSYLGTGQDPQLPSEVLNSAPVITKAGVLFIDPPVLSSDDSTPRVYALIHNYGVSGWPGAQIFKSIDGGASYNLIGSVNKSATWGKANTITAAAPYYSWDNTTVITVELKTGTLVSKSDEAVLAGDNLVMVGQECLAFGTATLIAPNTYELTHLLRGRKGTEWAIDQHVANELFCVLDESSMFKLEGTENERGKTYLYKVVTYGSDLSKVDAMPAEIRGENLIPWTPAKVKAVRNVNDWDVTWKTRSRFNNQIQDYIEIPNDFDFGGFAVVIYDGVTVKRQTIVYGNSFKYTPDMQIADFGSIQANLKVAVIQISNRYGGGRPIIVNS